ncbi:hypothetical protein ACH5RR_027590 [Cinchona calisaya]|uniref:Bromo domain-containing protein n=1 Tax=Cinchona calisaya TaxID=153742 RepID=A0ABD2Z5V8_9GENT
MERRKKKGRPSLLDLQKRQQQQQQKTLTPPPPPPNYNSAPSRRSTRRNPSNYNSPSSEFINDDYDDDDERQQKKVKLVVRLPQSTQQHLQNSPSHNSASASDSDADEVEDHEASPKKRKINAADRRSNDVVLDQGEKALKATDTVHGSPLQSGPTTPLPDKKMLEFVLDRLQKKDTYGVFSEPVDPNELPDYHEIIEHPMDFGSLRKKLEAGSYSNLEELEADVFLICSNAMQYNAADTIYFRQARSIQELAKRDFFNLRNEGDNGEPQPKVVRRGRPPNKSLKKALDNSPVDRIGHDLSGATLASAEDKAIGINGYNLRKAPAIYKVRSNDAFGPSYRSRNGENYSDWLVDWNSEFPASILRADMKYGKKHFSVVDENRRDTYKQFHSSTSSSDQSYSWNAFGDMKRLMAVGLQLEPHAYARSLARYAANLGPVAWNVASRKLKSALPDGLAFGPGWVEENDTLRQPLSSAEKLKQTNGLVHDHDPSRPVTSSSSGLNSAVVHRPSPEMIEAVRRLNCQNELAESFQAQRKSVFHPNRNGFNGMFGHELSSQMGIVRPTIQAGQSGLEGGSTSNQMLGMLSVEDVSSLHPGPLYQANSEEIRLSENVDSSQCGNLSGQASDPHIPSEAGISGRSPQQVLSAQHRQPLEIPPDLNLRVQMSGSPSSSLQIGSPQQQQPDLALQL